MYAGGVYIVEIKDEYKERFYNWAIKGSEKHSKSSIALMGLKIHFHQLESNKHFLVIEHNLFFNFSFFLKLYFILMSCKLRKYYTIRTAKQSDLVNFIGW